MGLIGQFHSFTNFFFICQPRIMQLENARIKALQTTFTHLNVESPLKYFGYLSHLDSLRLNC